VKLALELAGADAATTAFFDDSTRNVAAGRACGLFSVLVRAAVRGRDPVACGRLPSVRMLREQVTVCLSSARTLPGLKSGFEELVAVRV